MTNQEIFKIALSSSPSEEQLQLFKATWPKINEKKLFEEAVVDEVASHIGFLLKKYNIPHSSFWDKEYFNIEKRISILMDELEKVALSLKNKGIPIVALKNAGITKGIYQNFACSPMGDIDLLVRSKDFHRAHEIILNDLGYTFKFRSKFEKEDIEEAFRGGGTEYFNKVNDYIIWLELQWRPIAGRWIQPHNEPSGDELIDKSLEIKGSSVRILSPEDNLLQVSLHTAKHSYVRAPGFRLHSDVDRIIRFQDIDWDKFIENVLKLKVKTAVYFSLYFAKSLLKTPIPEDALKQLKPSPFRRKIVLHYIKKADFFNQKKKKFSKVGYIIFNLALYDSLSENLMAIFPPFESIKIKYPIKNKWQLPYFYIIRIKDLAFKRATL